jgi:hypothetical protein
VAKVWTGLFPQEQGGSFCDILGKCTALLW